MKTYYVYIISSKTKTIYTGVTSDLVKRIYEHKHKLVEGFTSQYNCTDLVYFEIHNYVEEAIKREKQIKKWKRQWKNELIEKDNPCWEDMYESILE